MTIVALALSVVVAVVVLVAVAALTFSDKNLHPVVTIDGLTFDRAALRSRMALDAALLDARRSAVAGAVSAGTVSLAERETLIAAIDAEGADPLTAAIDGFVDDQLIRAAADARGLTSSAVAPDELALAATRDLAVRVDWLSIVEPLAGRPSAVEGWPAPAPAGSSAEARQSARDAAMRRANMEISAGLDVIEARKALEATGWVLEGGERWIPADGRVGGVPDSLLVRLRDSIAPVGAVVDPVTDPVHGRTAIGRVVARGDRASAPARDLVSTHNLDAGTVAAWAQARADERALRDDLARSWLAEAQSQVRAAEVVVGLANLEGAPGPYVELAHVVVSQVPPGQLGAAGGASPGERLASALRALDAQDREARFAELVTAANRTPSDDPLRRSGNLSFYTKDQLIEPLAAAFAEGVRAGDLLGPITTSVGEEIFLVQARFDGVLDERANAALVEARATTDLLALARRISPAGDAGRATGNLWRSDAELVGNPAAHRAFMDGPIGRLSDPFVIDDQLVVARPLERRSASLDTTELDRLEVNGFASWLASARAGAKITIDPDPLGLGLASPSPTATPSGGAIETPPLPSIPALGPSTAPTFAIPTPPRLP